MGESAGYEPGHAKVDRPAGSVLFEDFPELWGRWPCLDLVNSLMSDHTGTGEVYDLMPLPGWQNAFLSLWKMSLDDPSEVAPLTVMVKVRRIVREALERWGRGESLPEADVRELNTILGLAPLSRAVAAGESRLLGRARPIGSQLDVGPDRGHRLDVPTDGGGRPGPPAQVREPRLLVALPRRQPGPFAALVLAAGVRKHGQGPRVSKPPEADSSVLTGTCGCPRVVLEKIARHCSG